jgi:hypothetical protein
MIPPWLKVWWKDLPPPTRLIGMPMVEKITPSGDARAALKQEKQRFLVH